MSDDVELREYEGGERVRDYLDNATALAFRQRFGKYVTLDFPTPANDAWTFKADGTVGYFPLDAERGVRVRPKVAVRNVVGMLARAYDLPVEVLERSHDVDTLDDAFDYLAGHLARSVLKRTKRGLAKAYQPRHDNLPVVRGRIDVSAQVRRPVGTRFACHYQEHTFDIHDNRVLRWTLLYLSRARLRDPAVKGQVRLAQHTLAAVVSAVPVRPQDAVARYYDRLRQDYRSMHVLCQLFLDNLTPTLHRGKAESMPLLIAMPALFERYVFAVLHEHLRRRWPDLRLDEQKHAPVTVGVSFKIDLVIQDASERTLLVLDTKYKNYTTPSSQDVQQAVAYAERMGCERAALVYPQAMGLEPFPVGRKQIYCFGIDLAGDLRAAAEAFCAVVDGVLRKVSMR